MKYIKAINITIAATIIVSVILITFIAGEQSGKKQVKELNNERIEAIVSDRLGNVSQALGNREARIGQLEEELDICMTPSNKIIQ